MIENKIIFELISKIGGITSILGGLFIVLHYMNYSKLRKGITNKLLLFQGLSDMGVGITYSLFGYHLRDQDILCKIQSILVGFFDLFSGMFPLLILTSILLISLGFSKNSLKILFYILLLISFIIPLLSVILLLNFNYLIGITPDGFCWIKQGDAIWRIYLFYIPIWINMIFIIIIYIFLYFILRNNSSNLLNSAQLLIQMNNQKLLRDYSLYPLSFIFLYSIASIKRIYDLFNNDDDQIFWLNIIILIVLQFRGLFNSIIYLFTQNILSFHCKLIHH